MLFLSLSWNADVGLKISHGSSPEFIALQPSVVMAWKRMGWARHVERTGETWNAYIVLV